MKIGIDHFDSLHIKKIRLSLDSESSLYIWPLEAMQSSTEVNARSNRAKGILYTPKTHTELSVILCEDKRETIHRVNLYRGRVQLIEVYS